MAHEENRVNKDFLVLHLMVQVNRRERGAFLHPPELKSYHYASHCIRKAYMDSIMTSYERMCSEGGYSWVLLYVTWGLGLMGGCKEEGIGEVRHS